MSFHQCRDTWLKQWQKHHTLRCNCVAMGIRKNTSLRGIPTMTFSVTVTVSGINSDILSDKILTFYLTFILTSYRTYTLWHFIGHTFWHSIWYIFWHCISSDTVSGITFAILSDIDSNILSDIDSDILSDTNSDSWGRGGNTAIGSWQEAEEEKKAKEEAEK